ncbi:helicase-related protein [Nitrosophilus labii]|uniref:helicase-related protein n=1 Tax=Nitrosophilus labii TaxID=2706014 RepID=UPI0016573056|nr:helicase-related protein [Nitrosophilus labii]
MSSKFFTNVASNSLENRLKDILQKHKNIKYLEFLIGYFRISGFKKIANLLDGIKRARILVGIDVDKFILEAKERGEKIDVFNPLKIADNFRDEQLKKLENEDYLKEIDESIEILANLLATKKIEIKIHPNKNIHSKIYILREKEITRHDGTIEYIGSVITGSSNLTESGLSRNFEFNVELKDSDDIEFALNEFERLWSEAVELTSKDIKTIKENSYLKEVTPYELYIKFLMEYFEDRVDLDINSHTLPKGFIRLAYQIDAVNEGVSKLKKHNGFFLSDVVGLGKTVTTAIITKRLLMEGLKGEILIITPPSIKKEWEETFNKFDIGTFKNYHITTLGKLQSIEPQNFELIIIDESHKFRNFSTSRYAELERITKESSKYKKKIILISATPFNNRPADIANQLYLFQDKRASTIPTFFNLENFFAQVAKEYKEIIKSSPIDKEKLKLLSKKIRENILREVMVRRTRSDILNNPMYKKDLQKQGLSIPEVEPVKEIKYQMDEKLTKIFYKTVDLITDKLSYERYKILYYLKPNARKKFGKISQNIFEKGSIELAKLMKNLLIKRFESSFHAFKISLKRQLSHLEKLIEMFEENKIYIGVSKNIFDILEDEESEEKLEKLLFEGKLKEFKKEDFANGYLEKLYKDLEILKELNSIWENVENDPKLKIFKQELQKQKGKKVVVFTESKDTAIYLKNNLKDFKVLVVHGENREKLKETVRENFDANYKTKKDDFNIIITTDTLSEGVNLHRSNTIYNYDIPWNSTRLMQRIGRINRIGSTFEKIYIYNFIPSSESDSLIELSKKALIKLQTFHSTLGEDNPIFSKDEEVGSVELFEKIDDDIDEELKFLEELREFKEAYPKKFNYIKNLPKKIRVQRKNDLKEVSFVFVKTKEAKGFFKVKNGVLPINFIEMAKNLKANINEKGVLPIKEFHYDQVKKALNFFENELKKDLRSITQIKIANRNDKEAIKILKSYRNKHIIDTNSYKILSNAIEQGIIQNLSKQIKEISKKENIPLEIEKLIDKYNLTLKDNKKKVDLNIEIVLSETFV